jgi:glycosyltransferase involved in cell wall biosynthesis
MMNTRQVKFALHANQFTERGDSVTILGIWKMLKDEFDISAVVTIPMSATNNSEKRLEEARRLGVELFFYRDRNDFEVILRDQRVTHLYAFSDGSLAGSKFAKSKGETRIGDLTIVTQAVFRNFEPHGDFYLYVSQWLYNWSASRRCFASLASIFGANARDKPRISWLPHIVEPMEGNGDYFRERYAIPSSAFLIGRIGGYTEFSDRAAQKAIVSYVERNADAFVVLVNTKPFSQNPRIIHVAELSRAEVWDFYHAADLLLNGRLMGESFGYSIVEPLRLGKPVIGPGLSRNPRMDKNHIILLRKFGLLYRSKRQLIKKIGILRHSPPSPSDLRDAVSDFTQAAVAERFSRIVDLPLKSD